MSLGVDAGSRCLLSNSTFFSSGFVASFGSFGLDSILGGEGQSFFSSVVPLGFCGLRPVDSEFLSTFGVEPKSRFGGGGGGAFFSGLGSVVAFVSDLVGGGGGVPLGRSV